MDSKAMATQDKAKEKAPRDKQSNAKDTTVMNKEKEKDIYIYIYIYIYQAATDVVNKATRQRTAELQCTTFRRISRKVTMMQPIDGMANQPPMTTIGGQKTNTN